MIGISIILYCEGNFEGDFLLEHLNDRIAIEVKAMHDSYRYGAFLS